MSGWHLDDLAIMAGTLGVSFAAGFVFLVVAKAADVFGPSLLRRAGALVAAVRLRFGGAR